MKMNRSGDLKEEHWTTKYLQVLDHKANLNLAIQIQKW